MKKIFHFSILLGLFLAITPTTSRAVRLPHHPENGNLEKSHWVEGTQALDDGATRDYYNRAARLPWRNYLGDWHDANGSSQGNTPFGMTTLIDDNTAEYIEWDIKNLLQAWVDGQFPNKGMILKRVSGGGTFKFYSRERANLAERPELVITTDTGTQTIAPEADTYLAPSTYQGMGDSESLEISDERPILLRFDLSGYGNGTTIINATLRLFVYAEYGGGSLDAGVFRCSQGHELPPSDPLYGISAQFPFDEGLESHPDVFLFEDFEPTDWGNDWTYGTSASTLETLISDAVRQFEPFQGKAVRVEIPMGSNTGMNVGYDFADEVGYEPEEIYFRYYLRYADDWDTNDGGKMPGISGTYGVAGWGGRPSNGSNGWSARGTFRILPPAGNPFSESVPNGNYVYHADMSGTYGDVHLWQNDYRGILEKNRWYSVEQYLKMNTPGENDGVMRAWVDGRLAWEKMDWRWRDIDSLKIERIWMNVYHGGTAPVQQDVHLYIDNVVIAKQYIGPMAPSQLSLNAMPGNQATHLNWTVNDTIPVTSTWRISYSGPTGDQPSPISNILNPTRAYTLTGLANYNTYSITLNAMLNDTPFLTDTVVAMPSDLLSFMPVNAHSP
jgi:hypothetical protein